MLQVSYCTEASFRIPEYREAKLTGRSSQTSCELAEMGEVDTVVETSFPPTGLGFPGRPVGCGRHSSWIYHAPLELSPACEF